jgi:DNA-binding response OmpR family regulator
MPDLHVGRVLLVEQPDGRDMLKWALEENGFEVDLANDGESALSIAAARTPAVVIADIVLPGMDGWELARRLRGIYGAAMRLVALTALGDPEDRAHSAAAGFNVHLVKPVRPGKVHDTILNLLAA